VEYSPSPCTTNLLKLPRLQHSQFADSCCIKNHWLIKGPHSQRYQGLMVNEVVKFGRRVQNYTLYHPRRPRYLVPGSLSDAYALTRNSSFSCRWRRLLKPSEMRRHTVWLKFTDVLENPCRLSLWDLAMV